MYTFTCLNCGKVFTTPYKRKFCSKPCNYAYKRVQKTCVICGQPFEVGRYHADELVTCRSKECKSEVHRRRMIGFKLSDEAKAKIGKANSKPHTIVECACGCGEKFDLPPHRMNSNKKTDMFFLNREHMDNWVRGEHHWNYRGGRSDYGPDWKRIAQSIRERDKVCQKCGKTPEENKGSLHVHHKIPVRVSHDNSPDNLIALCNSCHQTFQAVEQRMYPTKVGKRRKCLVCDKIFIPKPFQKFCSEECHRKRERQWEKKYMNSHPEYYKKRRAYIKKWQQANKDRVNESKHRSRLRRRSQE